MTSGLDASRVRISNTDKSTWRFKMPSVMHHSVSDSNPAASVGVQSWSRGSIFPAIIYRVEEYDQAMSWAQYREANPQLAHFERLDYLYRNYLANFYERSLSERIIARRWVLQYPGFNELGFASYDEAYTWAVEEMARPEDPEPSQHEINAAYWNARRTRFGYSAEQVAAGEMAGGSPVPNRIGLINRSH